LEPFATKSAFVISKINPSPRDVAALSLLRAAAKQDDQAVAALSEINPVTRPNIELVFRQTATQPLQMSQVSHFNPQQRGADSCRRRVIEA